MYTVSTYVTTYVHNQCCFHMFDVLIHFPYVIYTHTLHSLCTTKHVWRWNGICNDFNVQPSPSSSLPLTSPSLTSLWSSDLHRSGWTVRLNMATIQTTHTRVCVCVCVCVRAPLWPFPAGSLVAWQRLVRQVLVQATSQHRTSCVCAGVCACVCVCRAYYPYFAGDKFTSPLLDTVTPQELHEHTYQLGSYVRTYCVCVSYVIFVNCLLYTVFRGVLLLVFSSVL